MADRAFSFSVIVPVYNLERYVAEAVQSIFDQTIGFERNVQLIMVDDGSSDGSRAICESLCAKYPDNALFIHQENAGVSAARNAGLRHATGTYVNFFDGDDFWDLDTFEKAQAFFEEHPDVDVVSARQVFFEARTGYHGLDYKFKNGDRVIDLDEEPECVQLSVASSFFRRSALDGREFDERLSVGEDAKILTQVLFEKLRYGVLRSVEYHIRKRDDSTSATQGYSANRSRYVETMDYYYRYVRDLSVSKFGTVIPYAQYVLINGLKYRVKSPAPEILTEAEAKVYTDCVVELIRQLDDDVIIHVRNASASLRAYMLHVKHGAPVDELVVARNGWLRLRKGVGGAEKSQRFSKLTGKNVLRIESLSESSRSLRVDGTVRIPCFSKFSAYAEAGFQRVAIPLTADPAEESISILGDCYLRTIPFSIQIPAALKAQSVRFCADYDDVQVPLVVAFPEGVAEELESGQYVKYGPIKLQMKEGVLSLKKSLL